MSVIHLVGSNRLAENRKSTFRWEVKLPRVQDNTGGDYLLEVHSITVENYFPTIRQGFNDTLYVIYDGTPKAIVFDEGNYDIEALVSEINTEFLILQPGGTLFAEFETTQYKVNISIPAGHILVLERPNADESSFYQDYTLPTSDDRFLELVGWNFFNSKSLLLPGEALWTPNNVVRCRGPIWLDICTTLPVRGSFSQGAGQFNVIGRAYMTDTPYGSLFTSISTQSVQYAVNLLGHPSFELFLIDDHGQQIQPVPSVENVVIGYRMSFTPITESAS